MNIWDGTGLPPTGIEVITDHCGRTFKVKILAYAPKNGETAVMVEEIEPGDNKGCLFAWMADMCNFRPVRTPEQIAADQRLHAIRNACTAINSRIAEYNINLDCSVAMSATVEAMIDCGYRKFEIVEEDV